MAFELEKSYTGTITDPQRVFTQALGTHPVPYETDVLRLLDQWGGRYADDLKIIGAFRYNNFVSSMTFLRSSEPVSMMIARRDLHVTDQGRPVSTAPATGQHMALKPVDGISEIMTGAQRKRLEVMFRDLFKILASKGYNLVARSVAYSRLGGTWAEGGFDITFHRPDAQYVYCMNVLRQAVKK